MRAAADDVGDASKARAGARAREPPLRLGSSFVRWAGASPRHGGGGGGALTGWGGADKALGMETARPEVRRVEAAATSLAGRGQLRVAAI